MVQGELFDGANKIIIVIGIAVLVIVAIAMFTVLGGSFSGFPTQDSDSYIGFFQVEETVDPSGNGITSLSATVKNKTWLDFDGVNDFVSVSSEFTVVSFWYKNDTTDWQHIVNSSGVTYVNGSANTPVLFPIFYDGSDYLLGKTGPSTFFNGSIDDFRVFNSTITVTEANQLFIGGRF